MRPTLFNIPWFDIPIRSYGVMLMIGFLGGTWWAARRAARTKANPDLVVNLAFVCLLASVVGARAFYVIHYWREHFAGHGLWAMVNITSGGLEFYGGLIGAFIAGTVYLVIQKASFRLYADILAPSIMFGMGMTRIGCFLNGCCWGAPCPAEIPWSVRFPLASPAYYREWNDRLVALPAELIYVDRRGVASPLPHDWMEDYAKGPKTSGGALEIVRQAQSFNVTPADLRSGMDDHRTLPLHPTQLYSSMDGLLLAILLGAYFYRRTRHGTVFPLMLMLYAFQRFAEEAIRIDNPHDTAFLTVSQFVSVVLFLCGATWMVVLQRLPLRSPLAVPYVSPWTTPAPAQAQTKAPTATGKTPARRR
jgi:phosphatidylglycerol---prolipoprotein diacylglyceryl transferase